MSFWLNTSKYYEIIKNDSFNNFHLALHTTLHEAMNAHGLTISTNSLGGYTFPDVSGFPDSQVIATSDLGVWALGAAEASTSEVSS